MRPCRRCISQLWRRRGQVFQLVSLRVRDYREATVKGD